MSSSATSSDEGFHLDRLRIDGQIRLIDEDGGIHTASRRCVGRLPYDGLVSGDLLCGDANPIPEVGSGVATVWVVAVQTPTSGSRVSALGLQLAEGEVVRWTRSAGGGAGVDAGMAGFMSAAAYADLDEDSLFEQVDAKQPEDGFIYEVGDARVALSWSGLGDGVYDTLIGEGANGEPLWVALDFEVLSVPIFDEIEEVLPLRRGRREVLPGVTLVVPWFSPGRVRVRSTLKEGFAYARVRTTEGVVSPPVHMGVGPVTTDIRGFSPGDHLLVRRVTGYAAMPIAPESP